jgi:hypothetical protein
MNFFGLFRKPDEKTPLFPLLSDADKAVIEEYALTNLGKEAAIEVYRRNLPHVGKTNYHMRFMAEVDTNMPDLGHRASCRQKIVGDQK